MASLVVPVTFIGPKGGATIRTLVDTGAEMSVIPDAVAKRIGAPTYGKVSVRGAGRAIVKVGRVMGIEIPGTRLCSVGPSLVWVLPAGKRGGMSIGGRIQAILGYDFMQKAKMSIAAFTRTRRLQCKR